MLNSNDYRLLRQIYKIQFAFRKMSITYYVHNCIMIDGLIVIKI